MSRYEDQSASALWPDAALRSMNGASEKASVRKLRNHSLRYALNNELHARPFMPLRSPERIAHLAIPRDEQGVADDHAVLVALCERYGVTAPQPGVNHFSHDFGRFRLKWERHTEFVSYSFFERGALKGLFDAPALGRVAADWLDELPGDVVVAVHLVLLPPDTPPPGAEELAHHFAGGALIGSAVSGGAASVFTDYRIDPDGFSRLLIHDNSLGEHQAGLLAQRLLEVVTYGTMALLALPTAREIGPEIARCERELADATAAMAEPGSNDEERGLLNQLLQLASSIERLLATTSYRFRAAQAYHALVQTRIQELREERIDGLQTLAEFMERRLSPAMRTCSAVHERLENVSQRLARASNLLRTRVDIAVQRHSRDVLRSMNRRAKLQLALNELVEGLSVFAITYYALGVIAYPLAALGPVLGIAPSQVTGAAAPVVFAAAWLGLRRLRKKKLLRHRGPDPSQ